jgi:hypothetical protein
MVSLLSFDLALGCIDKCVSIHAVPEALFLSLCTFHASDFGASFAYLLPDAAFSRSIQSVHTP